MGLTSRPFPHELATDIRNLKRFSEGVIEMDCMGNCMARGAACSVG